MSAILSEADPGLVSAYDNNCYKERIQSFAEDYGLMAKAYLFCSALPLAVLAVCLQATSSVAAPLQGSWSGSGYVKPKAGQRERVRCRVSYTRLSRKVFAVSARCASASATLRQTGTVLMVRSNVYVGDFYNSQFDVRGRIRVMVSGAKQTVKLLSSDATGQLNLRKR